MSCLSDIFLALLLALLLGRAVRVEVVELAAGEHLVVGPRRPGRQSRRQPSAGRLPRRVLRARVSAAASWSTLAGLEAPDAARAFLK